MVRKKRIEEDHNPLKIFEIPFEIRKKKKLSILMPFYNEESRIVKNVNEVIRILNELDFSYEIVLIDDGSTDNSYNLLKENFSTHPFIKLVRNYRNFGKGWALKTGYEFSEGDFVLFLDSDLELSPYHIPNFFRLMVEEKADAVIGSKLHKFSILNYPFYRKVFSYAYYSIVKLLFGLPVNDTQTGIKLFKRDALEISLPKVLVKRFAFDIELLLILHKNGGKIVSAPIYLDYSRKFGWNIKPTVIINTFTDTLAVYYRDKFLKFYDRPFGKNIKFFYSILLFGKNYDELEEICLNKFLSLTYEKFEVILIGNKKLQSNKNYKFFEVPDEISDAEKFLRVIHSGIIEGDIIVISYLNAFPDEMFLQGAGRILSLEDLGAAGGYVVPFLNAKDFEKIAYNVIKSVTMNFNLVYRYKPVNFKKVKELNSNGIFIKKELLSDLKIQKDRRIEHIISEQIKIKGKEIYYSPDFFLYQKFPSSMKELIIYLRNKSSSRAIELKQLLKSKIFSIFSPRFLMPLFFPFFILICLSNKFLLTVLLISYGVLLVIDIYLYQTMGVIVFIFTIFSQLFYSLCFIFHLLFKRFKK